MAALNLTTVITVSATSTSLHASALSRPFGERRAAVCKTWPWQPVAHSPARR